MAPAFFRPIDLPISRRALLAGAAAAGVLLPFATAARPAAAAASTRSKKIALVLSHEQFPTQQLIDFGTAAEQAGFDGVWTSDHIQPWQEDEGHAMFPWITLALLGSRMQQAFFGTGVTTPTYRYDPAVVAQAFATLGVLYPGRVFLGVGTGEALNETTATGRFGPYQERHDRLAEAIGLIRQLWTGEHTTFSGQYYAVRDLRIYDTPDQPVPIYVAGNGPKSARLAGALGDGWITTPANLTNPDLHDAFRDGALSAGKDPGAMPILLEDFVVVGGEAEANEAATYWRFAPIGFQKLLYVPDPRTIQQRAMELLPTPYDVWQDWLVSMDPGDHVKHIQGLWDAGATHVFVHSGNPDQMRLIDFYAKQVLPQLTS
ncbi:MAG: TIGR03557 family F420-dependent LLM class oxidoreductase [Chloroflexi bacterium]|nr:TIGR03557 family F420-dependent LLM class oxidoreductase [Chloroflexota bacterium]